MTNFSRVRWCVLVLLALATPSLPAIAQVPLTPAALGMGGAYVASARGFESIFYNPANLLLTGGPAWSVAFPQISIGSSVLGPSVTDLRDYLNYDDQSPQRRQELLALIPANGTSVDLDVRAPVFALQVGRIGLGVAYGVMGEHTLGKDLVELFFEGYEQGRTDYRIGNTVGTRTTFWDLSAGVAHQFGPLSVGATGHYILGQKAVRTRAFEPEYDIAARAIRVDYVGVSSEGGQGFGVDLGVALQPTPSLTVSAAIANAFGSMDWDRELVGRRLTLTNQDFADSELLDLQDRYEQSEQSLGENPTGRFGEVASGLDLDEQRFPRVLRLGAAWRAPTRTEVGVAYNGNIGDGRLLGRWERSVGVGVQQPLGFLTLRVGGSSNLEEGSLLGGGVRLGVLDLGIARFSTASTLDNSERDGLIGSLSVNVRTRAMLR